MDMFRSNLYCCSYYEEASILLKLADSSSHKRVLHSLSGKRFENKVKLDCPESFYIFGFGSIDGTLLLHQFSSCKLVFWNPSTNEFKPIPPSPAEWVPQEAKRFFGVASSLHGFGYECVTNDYKILRYLHYQTMYRELYEDLQLEGIDVVAIQKEIAFEPSWEIYSLKNNSWKKLNFDMSPCYDTRRGTKLYMDGVCHWLRKNDSQLGPHLVSFDLINEVLLSITPIPSDVEDFNIRYRICHAPWKYLAVLNGSIALIFYREDTTAFHISILGELGIKESWTKIFIFGPLPCIKVPIGVGTKGEIFFIRKDNEIVWFDLNTQMINELGMKYEFLFYEMIIYKENMCPIGGISN